MTLDLVLRKARLSNARVDDPLVDIGIEAGKITAIEPSLNADGPEQDIAGKLVSPGLIDRAGLADDWPEGAQRWTDRAPLGRLGTPKDVADAVLFLLSPAARWISGANLVVDGGMSSQSRW